MEGKGKMINTIQFLKNYEVFASQARYHTALLFLNELKNNNLKQNNKKLLKLRIIEEYISATEDLALWLLVVSKRLDKSSNLDIWERLLLAEATPLQAKDFLNSVARLRSPKSILKKLDIISTEKLISILQINQAETNESLSYIIKAIKVTIQNRKASKEALIRAHNKIKHGMVVYLDGKDIDTLLIRDLRMVGPKRSKRKRNRYFQIKFDINRAEELVENILVISHAIRGLIYLVQADFRYRIISDKKITKKTKIYWLSELDKVVLE